MEGWTIALIAAGQILALAALQGWITSRKEKRDREARAQEKLEDWRRQDEVAKRVADAATAVSEVARVAAESDKRMTAKLDEGLEQGKAIHTLVNSDMTAARTAERAALKLLVIQLVKHNKLSEAEQDEIVRVEKRINELDQILADRLAAQHKVDDDAAAAAAKPAP